MDLSDDDDDALFGSDTSEPEIPPEILEDIILQPTVFEFPAEDEEIPLPFEHHVERNLTRWRETSLTSLTISSYDLERSLDYFEEVFRITQDKMNNVTQSGPTSNEQICRLVLISAETTEDHLPILQITNMIVEEMLGIGIDQPSTEAYSRLVNEMLEQFAEQVQFFRAVLIYPFWLQLTDDCISNFAREEGERAHVIHSIKQRILSHAQELPQHKRTILNSLSEGKLPSIGHGDVQDAIQQLFLFLQAAQQNPLITYSFYNQAYEGRIMRRFRNFVAFVSETVESTILGNKSIYNRLPGYSTLVEDGVESIDFNVSYKKQVRTADANRPKRPYRKSGIYSKKK